MLHIATDSVLMNDGMQLLDIVTRHGSTFHGQLAHHGQYVRNDMVCDHASSPHIVYIVGRQTQRRQHSLPIPHVAKHQEVCPRNGRNISLTMTMSACAAVLKQTSSRSEKGTVSNDESATLRISFKCRLQIIVTVIAALQATEMGVPSSSFAHLQSCSSTHLVLTADSSSLAHANLPSFGVCRC